MPQNLFERLLVGQPPSRIDTERFWAVVELMRERPGTVARISRRDLLCACYARDGSVRQSLAQIARDHGLHRVRISQKLTDALRQLRQPAVFRLYAYPTVVDPAEQRPSRLPPLDPTRPLPPPPPFVPTHRRSRFSTRERAVVVLIARGRSNRAIAQTLGISYLTAKVHVQHIYARLDIHRRLDAIVWAQTHGYKTILDERKKKEKKGKEKKKNV